MSTQSLLACANWNGEKGLALVRQSTHEKNNDRYAAMCRDAGRYLRNHDRLVREAWITERTKARPKKEKKS